MFDITAFDELFGNALNDFDINISYRNSRRTVYCEKSHRLTDEKYILSITGKKIDIECSGEKSAFYALCDIAKRRFENRLCDSEYICAPSFAVSLLNGLKKFMLPAI